MFKLLNIILEELVAHLLKYKLYDLSWYLGIKDGLAQVIQEKFYGGLILWGFEIGVGS